MQESSPRHLDPTASYWANDTTFTYQIYEPPYGYHYLKRPYQLIGKAAEDVAKPRYLDKDGQLLPDDAPAEQIAESVYDVHIKPGILYQPHPASPRTRGHYLYHPMSRASCAAARSPLRFRAAGHPRIVADDYVYALKRHATTRIEAPVFGIFSRT